MEVNNCYLCFFWWTEVLSGASDSRLLFMWSRTTPLNENKMYAHATPKRMLIAMSHRLNRRMDACKAAISSCLLLSCCDAFSVCSLLSRYKGSAASLFESPESRRIAIMYVVALVIPTRRCDKIASLESSRTMVCTKDQRSQAFISREGRSRDQMDRLDRKR